MGPKEIEAVRAFCRFAKGLAGGGAGVMLAVVAVDLEPKRDVDVSTMIMVGDIIEKMRRGMTASAIATPSGPVLVEALKGGSFLVKRSRRSDRCEWKDLAVVLYEALGDAGGPLVEEPRAHGLADLWTAVHGTASDESIANNNDDMTLADGLLPVSVVDRWRIGSTVAQGPVAYKEGDPPGAGWYEVEDEGVVWVERDEHGVWLMGITPARRTRAMYRACEPVRWRPCHPSS